MIFRQLIVSGIALILMVGLNGCAMFSKDVKLEDIPSAAQAAIQSHTSGGSIEKITCEKEDGEHFYKVEYIKGGREFELEVDEKGNIMETEEILSMKDLPPAVLATVNAETKGGTIKELAHEIEDGKIFYEVEFEKDGKEHEVKIGEDGTVLERETE
jgi:uncharacterized membrane protein YkoI